ncbi:MAG: hypothetical protein E4G90_03855 [Gemmatimonadales bacterium]|nr:MAG: hypothetical protein E4G90_03855 [Gemmatimonadales bacterium]
MGAHWDGRVGLPDPRRGRCTCGGTLQDGIGAVIPPNIAVDLNESVRDFWKRRLEVHTHDTYRGLVLAKMPEDLRTYQHIIEESKPEVVLELGSFAGGSALWFADQLQALLGRKTMPLVVSVDISAVSFRDDRVVFINGDVKNHSTQMLVEPYLRGRRVMISEDSQHTYESTIAALNGFARFVSPGCWFVVEDGIVDSVELRLPRYRGGIDKAIVEFLAADGGRRFERFGVAPYGITTCINGWLKAAP